MEQSISHDRNEESIESKARWFQSLSLEDRMELLCEFTEMALTVNPAIQEKRHAQSPKGRIQIIEKT